MSPQHNTITVAGDYESLGQQGTRFRIFAPPGVQTRTAAAGTLDSKLVSAESSRCLYAGYRYESPLAGIWDGSAAQHRQTGTNFAGLHYTLHRHYDPVLMRFTSPDPIAAEFWNLNSYSGNSPARYFDPDGLLPVGAGPDGRDYDWRDRNLYGGGELHFSKEEKFVAGAMWSAFTLPFKAWFMIGYSAGVGIGWLGAKGLGWLGVDTRANVMWAEEQLGEIWDGAKEMVNSYATEEGRQKKFNEISDAYNNGDGWDAGLQFGEYTGGAVLTAYGGFRLGTGVASKLAPVKQPVGPSMVNRGVGSGNPIGWLGDKFRGWRLGRLHQKWTWKADAAISAGDEASLRRWGASRTDAANAVQWRTSVPRGNVIDAIVKKQARSTFGLKGLTYTPRGRLGPDIYNPKTMRAWDMTTLRQWNKHVSGPRGYISPSEAGRPLWRQLNPLIH